MLYQKKLSSVTLVLMALIVCSLFALLETTTRYNPWYQDKLEAANLMNAAIAIVKTESKKRGIEPDTRFDPNGTGLIGPQESLISTDRGVLDAKLMTTQPNFAAAVVDMLKMSGVEKGDVVAVSCTGSMPGANIAVLAACEALHVKPIVISSVGASSWGATHPNFTWPDIEAVLVKKGIFSSRSVAASMGGSADRAAGNTPDGREAIRSAIVRNGLMLIDEKTIDASVDRRMAIYQQYAGNRLIKAFINVGGGIVSLGSESNGALLNPGLNMHIDTKRFYARGMIMRMAEKGIPVIHLLKVREIVRDYELSRFPVPMPEVGKGKVFYEERYDLKSALLILFGMVAAMTLLVEIDLRWIPRWTQSKRNSSQKGKKTNVSA